MTHLHTPADCKEAGELIPSLVKMWNLIWIYSLMKNCEVA